MCKASSIENKCFRVTSDTFFMCLVPQFCIVLYPLASGNQSHGCFGRFRHHFHLILLHLNCFEKFVSFGNLHLIRFPVGKSVSLVLSSVHILFVIQSCTECVFVVFRQSTVDSARAIHARLVHSCIQTSICFHSAIVRKKIIASTLLNSSQAQAQVASATQKI